MSPDGTPKFCSNVRPAGGQGVPGCRHSVSLDVVSFLRSEGVSTGLGSCPRIVVGRLGSGPPLEPSHVHYHTDPTTSGYPGSDPEGGSSDAGPGRGVDARACGRDCKPGTKQIED